MYIIQKKNFYFFFEIFEFKKEKTNDNSHTCIAKFRHAGHWFCDVIMSWFCLIHLLLMLWVKDFKKCHLINDWKKTLNHLFLIFVLCKLKLLDNGKSGLNEI